MKTFTQKAVEELREIAKSYKSSEDKGWLAKGQISDFVNWEEIEQLFTQKLEQLAKQKDEEFMEALELLMNGCSHAGKYQGDKYCDPCANEIAELRNKLRGGKDDTR